MKLQQLLSTGQNQTNNTTLIVDIMSLARANTCYREEFKTANHTQVVLMSLKPGEEIGLEVHRKIDQLLVFVQGSGMANISGQTHSNKGRRFGLCIAPARVLFTTLSILEIPI